MLLDKTISCPRRLAHAAVLVALLLFGSLAQTIHEATVSHAICPEHGELLDVHCAPAAAAAHEHAISALADHAQPGQSAARATPSESEPQHDECWFATMLRPSSSPWIGIDARSVAPPSNPVQSIARECARVAAIAPLSLAPKHSPPARAA